jgi:DNA-binding NarL/FixJ family response regulator
MKKVLIVEDESLIAMCLTDILTDAGFIITDIATNADDAMSSLLKNKPDIVLLDVFIKGCINGILLAKYINENFQIPFFFVTANSDPNITLELIKTKPQGIIFKPFDNKYLIKALNSDPEKVIINQTEE